MLVNTHIAFNLTLLFAAMPLVGIASKFSNALLPDTVTENSLDPEQNRSALDFSATSNSTLALASLKRELLRMGDIVERMATPVMEIYGSGDVERISGLQNLESQLNTALTGMKTYMAVLPTSDWDKRDRKSAREMVEYAISLESAGDIIAHRLLPLANEKAKKNLRFSSQGWSELRSMHETVLSNMRLATNVLVCDDLESARLLVAEKTEFNRVERKSRKRHLKRLSEGGSVSFETSDIHLETLRGLKDLNSFCAYVAYPILYRNGQLLETRLIETLDEDHQSQ